MITLTTLFLAISGSSLIHALVYLLIIALIFWLIQWGLAQIGVPEPFNKLIKVVLVIVAVIICINFLLGLTEGGGFISW